MANIIELRNEFFEKMGKKRWKRIVLWSFFIASIWNFADWLSGSLEYNIRNDFICLFLGILTEIVMPWGKTNSEVMKKVRQATKLAENVQVQNKKLTETVNEQSDIIKKLIKQNN